MAYAGDLSFNPLTDSLPLPSGHGSFRFTEPTGDEAPSAGYVRTLEHLALPPADGSAIDLVVSPRSQRIQLIKPFAPWSGEDEQPLRLLIKVDGKCSALVVSAVRLPPLGGLG
jgi:aconitate hydratase